MGTAITAIKHPVPDRVKPSFVIFDIRALWRSGPRVPGCQNYKWRLNPVWHRMLYSCTHMATVGVKGLIAFYDTRPGNEVGLICNTPEPTWGTSHWQFLRLSWLL